MFYIKNQSTKSLFLYIISSLNVYLVKLSDNLYTIFNFINSLLKILILKIKKLYIKYDDNINGKILKMKQYWNEITNMNLTNDDINNLEIIFNEINSSNINNISINIKRLFND